MTIKEVTLTKVYKGTKETKFGVKPIVALKTVEYGDKWMSTFKIDKVMDNWKEGDKITLDIEVTDKFTNFKLPDLASNLELRVARLEKSVFGDSTTNEEIVDIEDTEVKPKGMDDFDF